MPEDMLPHQVSFHAKALCTTPNLRASHGLLFDLQALDPGILDDVPVAPQLVRPPGPVP